MAMVMPRSRSSGALSIVSKARYSDWPFIARYLVMAAVRLVLPWSMWPMVPMLTCGLVRSNFFLAMASLVPIPLTWGIGPGAGAHIGIRTQDLFLTKEVLCQLSYVGAVAAGKVSRRVGGQGGNRTPTVERRLIYSQRSSPTAQPTQWRLRWVAGGRWSAG